MFCVDMYKESQTIKAKFNLEGGSTSFLRLPLIPWSIRLFIHCWGTLPRWIFRRAILLVLLECIYIRYKVRGSVGSPILSPGILNQPATKSFTHIPTDNLHSLFCRKSLIFWVNLIESFLIDEEISVDGNSGNNWSVVEYFLFNVLYFWRDTIISNFVSSAGLSSLTALLLCFLWSSVIFSAGCINKSIYFGVVESSSDYSSFAVGIDDFITEDWSMGWENWELKFVVPAPSVRNGAYCSNWVRRWTISLSQDRSGTSWINFFEIVDLRDDGFFIICVALEERIFVGGLGINHLLGID